MNLGLYIHIPFCRDRKCDYCDFYSIPVNKNDAIIDSYIKRLHAEICLCLKGVCGYSVDSIYFGGGTPSILSPRHVDFLLNAINKEISISKNAEISLECNPEDISRENMLALRDSGINRLTLGVQTLNRENHAIIGRSSTLCSLEILDLFCNIPGIIHAFDIISGIPGQDVDGFLHEMELLARYKPEHISVYTLSIEKRTPLYNRLSYSPQLEQHQREHLEKTILYLNSAGYHHYEISNYCLPGFESKHNMKYWAFDPYIGFGPGSHSFFQNSRYLNNMQVADYIIAHDVAYTIDERSEKDIIVEYIMTGLRLLKGISISEMISKLGISYPENLFKRINRLATDKLLLVANNNDDFTIKLSDTGVFFLDSIIFDLVQDYL